jgi:hypothetical protein
MKKTLIVLAVIAVFVGALGFAGAVYAQTQSTPQPGYGMGGMMGRRGQANGQANNGVGMMGGRGGYGAGGMMVDGQEGPMHDAMVAALAEKLGMSAADVEAKIDAGVSMWTLAQEKGLSLADFQKLMADVRTSVLGTTGARGRGNGFGGCPMLNDATDGI